MSWQWTPGLGWHDTHEVIPITTDKIIAGVITTDKITAGVITSAELKPPVCGFNIDRTGDWPAPDGALNADGTPAVTPLKLSIEHNDEPKIVTVNVEETVTSTPEVKADDKVRFRPTWRMDG